MKKCNKCSEVKPFIEFPKETRSKSGYRSTCKICSNQTNKSYREDNRESFNNAKREYYQNNIEYLREQKRINSQKFKLQKAEYDRQYRILNNAHIAELKKLWFKGNLTPERRIKINLRRRVHHAIQDNYKSASTLILLGCSVEQFKTHLELQFTEGMTWDNYGQWHIDHIKPCYSFDLSKPEQQLECFNYLNQRPLWAIDNLSRPRPAF